MTQHRWQTTDGFEVLAGWDRPLQHYFFQVSRRCPSCAGTGETETGAECIMCAGRGDQYVFDNLDAADKPITRMLTDPLGGMSIEQVKLVMVKFLTAWPDEFVASVAMDARNNIGNQIYTYDTVGTVKL